MIFMRREFGDVVAQPNGPANGQTDAGIPITPRKSFSQELTTLSHKINQDTLWST